MGASYGAVAVDEVPPKGTGGGGRSLAKSLGPEFEKIVGEPGWYEMGTWESTTGAATAKRTIAKNAHVVLPAGHSFELEARKTGENESRLYARHLGEDVGEDAELEDDDEGDE